MSRMFDRFMANGVWCGSTRKGEGYHRPASYFLTETDDELVVPTVVLADELVEYLYRVGLKPGQMAQQYNLLPPWNNIFLEYSYPDDLKAAPDDPVRRWAFLISYREYSDKPLETNKWGNAKYIMFWTQFMEMDEGIFAPIYVGFAGVAEDGKLAELPDGKAAASWAKPDYSQPHFTAEQRKYYDNPKYKAEADDQFGQDLFNIMHYITFFHVRGAKVERHDYEPPSRQVKRAIERGKMRPLHTFHTLNIPGIRETLHYVREHNGDTTVHGGKRLHICRGHLATYTPEKPLFGHFVGTVFRPPHWRGAKEKGLVEKDYHPEPGKEAS